MYKVVLLDKNNNHIGDIGEYQSYKEAKKEANSYNRKSDRHRGRATVEKRINPLKTEKGICDQSILAASRQNKDKFVRINSKRKEKRSMNHQRQNRRNPTIENPSPMTWVPLGSILKTLLQNTQVKTLTPYHIKKAWNPMGGKIMFEGTKAILENSSGEQIEALGSSKQDSLRLAINKLGGIVHSNTLKNYKKPQASSAWSGFTPPKKKSTPSSQDPFQSWFSAPSPYKKKKKPAPPPVDPSKLPIDSYASPFKGHYYDSHKKISQEKGITAAGGVVIRHDGKVLLVEPANHFNSTAWTLPKGTIDQGETPQEAATREVWEESGWKTDIVRDIQGVWTGTASVTKYFLMKPIGQQEKWENFGKHSEETWQAVWVPYTCAQLLLSTSKEKIAKRDLEVLKAGFDLWKSLQ